jgi:hypothetical protein
VTTQHCMHVLGDAYKQMHAILADAYMLILLAHTFKYIGSFKFANKLMHV